MIDKDLDEWKSEPVWVRIGAFGIRKRSHLLMVEYLVILAGVVLWVLDPLDNAVPLFFLVAYTNSKLVAYIDNKNYW